jgi:hypothetical protein
MYEDEHDMQEDNDVEKLLEKHYYSSYVYDFFHRHVHIARACY